LTLHYIGLAPENVSLFIKVQSHFKHNRYRNSRENGNFLDAYNSWCRNNEDKWKTVFATCNYWSLCLWWL